jgi:hypothetical protein
LLIARLRTHDHGVREIAAAAYRGNVVAVDAGLGVVEWAHPRELLGEELLPLVKRGELRRREVGTGLSELGRFRGFSPSRRDTRLQEGTHEHDYEDSVSSHAAARILSRREACQTAAALVSPRAEMSRGPVLNLNHPSNPASVFSITGDVSWPIHCRNNFHRP